MKKKQLNYLVQGAVIAALYATLTYFSGIFSLAYGSIQFRISEALTILPVLSPAAIPGVAIGCLLGNLGSPYGIIDIVFGTLATLIAAILSRALRNITIKNIPILSILSPVIMNGLIVGMEITMFLNDEASMAGFALISAQVAAGELLVCTLLGIPLLILARKLKLLDMQNNGLRK